eukprot:COSAG01_NODE_4561_length_4919_cov_20.385213_4_plen_146_part_01
MTVDESALVIVDVDAREVRGRTEARADDVLRLRATDVPCLGKIGCGGLSALGSDGKVRAEVAGHAIALHQHTKALGHRGVLHARTVAAQEPSFLDKRNCTQPIAHEVACGLDDKVQLPLIEQPLGRLKALGALLVVGGLVHAEYGV